jgi:NADH-quinone oxidoreductase subunit M
MLWMYQRVFLGPVREGGKYHGEFVLDLDKREIGSLIPLAIFVLWIGVFPGTFLNVSAPAAKKVVTLIDQARRGESPRLTSTNAVVTPVAR